MGKIEAAVDSAAVDSVMFTGMLPHIKKRPSERSRTGRHYVAANDIEIRNLGEREVEFKTHEGEKKTILFQDAEVGRCLISVDAINNAGNEVILNRQRPRIVCKDGKEIRLKRKNGVFVLNMWVKVPEGGESKDDMDIDEVTENTKKVNP